MTGAKLSVVPGKYKPGVDEIPIKISVNNGRGMVGRLGFEPRTNDLKGRCSTIELSTHGHRERAVIFTPLPKARIICLLLSVLACAVDPRLLIILS